MAAESELTVETYVNDEPVEPAAQDTLGPLGTLLLSPYGQNVQHPDGRRDLWRLGCRQNFLNEAD